MKKIYRAIEGHCVEKRFIADMADVPKGWFETPREAMDDWADRHPKPRAVPRRVEPAAPPPPPLTEVGEVGDAVSEFDTRGDGEIESENVGEATESISPVPASPHYEDASEFDTGEGSEPQSPS